MKILIAAPYYRCGSTLVQRCIHQCDDTIIKGEMNGFFHILDTLGMMSLPKGMDVSDKEKNWENKIDDDYSLCYQASEANKIMRDLEAHLLSHMDFPDIKNTGLKVIGLSNRNMSVAVGLGYNIIYVKRNMKDALASFMGQPWFSIDNFYMAHTRSSEITEKAIEYYKEKSKAKFYELEFENISTGIKEIIDNLGLVISEEKLQAVLNNKINPGQ